MPTTQQNVSLIKYRCQNFTRQEILDALNEIQLIVYSQDCVQTMKVDSSTGEPPYLATTDGVREYVCPSDCRRTAAVFARELRQNQYSSLVPGSGPGSVYRWGIHQYYKIPVSSRDATENALATVTFYDNPGDSSTDYYHAYYVKPTPLTDESIPLLLPEETHWRLRSAVLAMLAEEEFGESGTQEVTIERVARKIRNSLNRGAQLGAGQTPMRVQDQDFDRLAYGSPRYYG